MNKGVIKPTEYIIANIFHGKIFMCIRYNSLIQFPKIYIFPDQLKNLNMHVNDTQRKSFTLQVFLMGFPHNKMISERYRCFFKGNLKKLKSKGT